MTAVRAAVKSVRRMASHAPNWESALERSERPWPKPLATMAESGRTTIPPRYRRATPRSDQRPTRPPAPRRTRPEYRETGPGAVVTDIGALPPRRLVRRGERPARAEHRIAIELVPAADVVGGEQILDGRELVPVTLLRGGHVDGALVPDVVEHCLGVRRVEVLHERGGDVLDAV